MTINPDNPQERLLQRVLDAFPALSLVVEDGGPGLPDDAFTHDGKMTKAEVRAVTLAALMPARGERLWDIGTGCGSVAIEWMRAARDGPRMASNWCSVRA